MNNLKRISFVKSLMSFNERVLYNGYIVPKKIYSPDELKRKLFFNSIFLSNMNEVFQKYDCSEIVDRYINNLKQYISNIVLIIKAINYLDIDYAIPDIDNYNFDNFIISDKYNKNYIFNDNTIYFASKLNNNDIIISKICNSVYSSFNLLGIDILDNYFIKYLNNKYGINNTISFKPTISKKNNNIVKVELNEYDSINYNYIHSIFPMEALIIRNPFISVNEIDKYLDYIIKIKTINTQKYENITFDDIFQRDLIFEYPTVSFDVYLHLLSLASNNKNIKSIYLSLYRIGDDSNIYYILKNAIDNGIKVYVNLELFASGEEVRNRIWLDEMKKIGVHITTYASGELKVHSKLTLFVFKNGKAISQIGTGNYHTRTTSQYTDLSLVTSNRNICNQVLNLFHIFQGKSKIKKFDKNLLVTKYNARKELIELIKEQATLGENGYISFKCNALDDKEINKYLSYASKNKCQIDLIIRGVCTWIPDELGFNVRIKSVIWDKLEHSRVYCFGSVNPTIYIGSLDLVTNKLDKRIETLVKINDYYVLKDLCSYLNNYIRNATNSWTLLRSGEYTKEF